MTTGNIADINQEIDSASQEPENIEVVCDPQTGQLVEFHREIQENPKTA